MVQLSVIITQFLDKHPKMSFHEALTTFYHDNNIVITLAEFSRLYKMYCEERVWRDLYAVVESRDCIANTLHERTNEYTDYCKYSEYLLEWTKFNSEYKRIAKITR